MGVMATLGRSGHVVTEWDVEKPKTVDEARVKFEELMGQGFSAFQTIAKAPAVPGPIHKQIDSFDPTADRISMLPQWVGG